MSLAAGRALWLSAPSLQLIEHAAARLDAIMLDLEHGVFDLAELEQTIVLCRAYRLPIYVKVLEAEPAAIQRPLDLGADGVIIPHVRGVEHARQLAEATKYPPEGVRSCTGGRIFDYGRPSAESLAAANRRCLCLPMVETAEALGEIEAIMALPSVDGVFLGPTDLALDRGRAFYGFDAEDRADLERIVRAARTAGKPWLMPAWSPAEQRWAKEQGADLTIVATDRTILTRGLELALTGYDGA